MLLSFGTAELDIVKTIIKRALTKAMILPEKTETNSTTGTCSTVVHPIVSITRAFSLVISQSAYLKVEK